MSSFFFILNSSSERIPLSFISANFSSVDNLESSVADLFRQTDSPTFAKAQELCYLLEDLPGEMQDVILDLVENTVYSLKKLHKIK